MDLNEEAVVEQNLSELEQNALARRRRLQALRARMAQNAQKENGQREAEDDEGEGEDGQNDGEGEEPISLLFRSYKPEQFKNATDAAVPHLGKTKEDIDALEKNIADQLEASQDTKVQDTLDLNTLAPRKVDWDLRRGIQDKLDKLDRRTRRAINQIIRMRLDEEREQQMDIGAELPAED